MSEGDFVIVYSFFIFQRKGYVLHQGCIQKLKKQMCTLWIVTNVYLNNGKVALLLPYGCVFISLSFEKEQLLIHAFNPI